MDAYLEGYAQIGIDDDEFWLHDVHFFDEMNLSHSAHTYMTALTLGVTLISDSGHDYSLPTPVPEPETYAMLLTGLGLLGFMARRRKISSSDVNI